MLTFDFHKNLTKFAIWKQKWINHWISIGIAPVQGLEISASCRVNSQMDICWWLTIFAVEYYSHVGLIDRVIVSARVFTLPVA